MTDEQRAWVQERPPAIHALMIRFPPCCEVRANRPLVCPAPGETARIASYTEGGEVSVTFDRGESRAFCKPDWLEVVSYADGMTPDDVRAALQPVPS